MESVDPVVLLSLTTLSGEACHIELPRSATVADARKAAIPSLGHRARSGKVMVGTQDLKDTDLAADFSSESWCIVFTNDRRTLLEAAQAASQSEEYEEATEHLRDLVQQHSDLTKDENHLLSSVFKAHSGTLRAAWRKAAAEGAATAEAAQLEAWCLKALQMLEDRLLPMAGGCFERLVYGRMAGDFYRYMVELGGDSRKMEERQQCGNLAYKAAMAVQEDLMPTHPARLYLALNYSVFLHDILADKDQAIQVARFAFEDAIGFNMGRGEDWEFEGMDRFDVARALQMLRDNLTLWHQEDINEEIG